MGAGSKPRVVAQSAPPKAADTPGLVLMGPKPAEGGWGGGGLQRDGGRLPTPPDPPEVLGADFRQFPNSAGHVGAEDAGSLFSFLEKQNSALFV